MVIVRVSATLRNRGSAMAREERDTGKGSC